MNNNFPEEISKTLVVDGDTNTKIIVKRDKEGYPYTDMLSGICIYCGSTDLDYEAMEILLDGETIMYPTTCNKCGKDMREYYRMEFTNIVGRYPYSEDEFDKVFVDAMEEVASNTTFSWKEAYNLMTHGAKITADEWLPQDYLYLDDGIIKDDGGNDYISRLNTNLKWRLYEFDK